MKNADEVPSGTPPGSTGRKRVISSASDPAGRPCRGLAAADRASAVLRLAADQGSNVRHPVAADPACLARPAADLCFDRCFDFAEYFRSDWSFKLPRVEIEHLAPNYEGIDCKHGQQLNGERKVTVECSAKKFNLEDFRFGLPPRAPRRRLAFPSASARRATCRRWTPRLKSASSSPTMR